MNMMHIFDRQDGQPLMIRRRLRWRQRHADRLASRVRSVALHWVVLVMAVLALVGLLYAVGRRAGKSSSLVGALVSAVGKPGVALGIAAVLVLVAGACFQRIWFERLARMPGPISVREIKAPPELDDVDAQELSARFRQRLQAVRLQAPTALPGAIPAQDFLDMLDADRIDAKNPLATAVRILRAAMPTHAYEVTPALLAKSDAASGARYRVAVQVTRLPGEAIAVPDAGGDSWQEAVVTAADIVTAAVLPRTRLSNQPPWSGWWRYPMPPLLVHNFELAQDFSATRKYDEAMAHCLDALKDDPKNVDVRLQMGFVQEKLGLSLDALATYAAAREIAVAPSALYNHHSQRDRRASGQIAYYRLAVLLSGVNAAHQWRKPRDTKSRRRAQRMRLHLMLKPRIIQLLRDNHLLVDTGTNVAGRPPWSESLVDMLLERHGDDDGAYPYFELRNVFAYLARQILHSLCTDLRRPWAPTTWLSPLAVQLTLDQLDLRHAWVKHKLKLDRDEFEALWPPDPEKLRKQIPDDAKQFCTWTERYNAGCLFALPLLTKELLFPEDPEKDCSVRQDLARRAVDQLAQGMSCATSAYVASRSDWLLSEDPDLNGLRDTDQFMGFEVSYFPRVHRFLKGRPADLHRWERSHHVNKLLSETAHGWQNTWNRRGGEIAEAANLRLAVLDWYESETEAWELVKGVAGEYRDWPTRYALIEKSAQWAIKYGFEPLQVSTPLFDRDASEAPRRGSGGSTATASPQRSATPRAGAESVDDEIEQNNKRLEHVRESFEKTIPQLKGFRTEFCAQHFWHSSDWRSFLSNLCDAHAAVWQTLHDWIEERPYNEDSSGRARFEAAVTQARPRHETSLRDP
jgi:hypothetical protein